MEDQNNLLKLLFKIYQQEAGLGYKHDEHGKGIYTMVKKEIVQILSLLVLGQ